MDVVDEDVVDVVFEDGGFTAEEGQWLGLIVSDVSGGCILLYGREVSSSKDVE